MKLLHHMKWTRPNLWERFTKNIYKQISYVGPIKLQDMKWIKHNLQVTAATQYVVYKKGQNKNAKLIE